eukprot:3555077-Pyramimonas_sp.AAC.1
MLADTYISAEVLADVCRQFTVEENSSISASQVGRVRDAGAETLKDMLGDALAKRMAGAIAEARPVGHALPTVYLVHVHDGADLRLRSQSAAQLGDVHMALPRTSLRMSRSRSSSVQNHCLKISFAGETYPWFTDLHALENKSAAIIATSVIRVVSAAVSALLRDSAVLLGGRQVRFVHLCTADAAFANEAAMRIVALFFMQDFELANRITYRLILYRCASHKVNLAVQFAICRQRLRNPIRSHRLCCNAVRLFKYLTPPYADHFGMQLRDHIIRGFEIFERAALPDDQRPDYGLRRLYGDDVITPEIAKLLNVDFRRLEMACPPGAELREMRGLLYSELYRSIIRVENHPVITRFFLFTDCAFAILRAQLLQIPSSVFSLHMANLRGKGQKRITGFREYYDNEADRLDLKRACLNLRLTKVANVTCSKKPKPGDDPVLVQIGRGRVQAQVTTELCDVLANLHHDASLDLTDTVLSLLSTTVHVCLRFGDYNVFNYLWEMTLKYNPDECVNACGVFLRTPASKLDGGYGVLLQLEALQYPTLPEQLDFLLGDSVQEELVDI